jgi:hypothetical protein
MPNYTYQIGQTHHTWTVTNHIPEADERGCIQFAPRLQETYRILLEMLAFWTRVAEKHRIRWFAVAGTLLGAVRNQGIIPFDDDIDLGVPIDQHPKLARLSRLELDPVYGIFLTEGCGARVYQRNGAKTPAIDLFLMGLDDSDRRYVYAGPLVSAGKPTYFLSHTFAKEWVAVRDVHPSVLKWVPFENLRVPIPRHARTMLRRVYGSDCLTRYVPFPQLHIAHRVMDLAPLHMIHNLSEVLFMNIMTLDYRSLNMLYQLVAMLVQPDVCVSSLTWFLLSQVHVNQPKRAFDLDHSSHPDGRRARNIDCQLLQ